MKKKLKKKAEIKAGGNSKKTKKIKQQKKNIFLIFNHNSNVPDFFSFYKKHASNKPCDQYMRAT